MRAAAARLLTLLLLPTAINLSMVAEPRPASADTAPPDAGVPVTVSSDPLPTAQHNGVVWSQVVVGNTVYAAGDFSRARPAGAAKGSAAEVVRTDILAYNITTGELLPFAPTTDGAVEDIAAAPDGSAIYIGGTFTQVNGVNRYRLAALNPTTGALITGFFPILNATVKGLAVTADTVYFGGIFTSVNGTTRIHAAAVDRATGATRPFNANLPATSNRRVLKVAVSPAGDKVVIGGNFETVNGSANPGYGLALLNSTSGALLPMPVNGLIRNGRDNAAITDLVATASGFYGTGYVYGAGGNFEGAFKADWDGNLIWMEDCHGDSYAVFPVQNQVYVAGHPHYCGNVGGFPQPPSWIYQRGIAFSDDVRGTISRDPLGYYNYEGQPRPALLNWFPDINAGTYTGQKQGPWSVSGNDDYIVYAGEFTSINNKAQEGLVRFARNAPAAPHADGPRLGAANFVPIATSFAEGIRLSWPANHDRDNELLTYRVIKDGNTASPIFTTTARSTWWQRPYLGFLDPVPAGESHTYRIRTTDPKGNTADGGTITVTANGGRSLSAYDQATLRDGPQSYWSLDETIGTTAADVSSAFNGTRGSGVSTGVPGAIAGHPGTAYRFNGTSTGTVASTTGTPRVAPQIFSIETWFRMPLTNTTGGKLIGFGNAATGNSTAYDRHIFLSNLGRLTFGVNNGQQKTLSPTTTYRDGQWHHVVGTLSPAGMYLYVDGQVAASRTDAVYAQIINSGYWRIGGDNTANWAGTGTSGYFAGDLDNVAVYHHSLTAAQVAAHYAARTGPANQLPTANFTSTSNALTASFDASASADPDGTIASYAWNFGDATTGAGVNPTHTYATAGTRNVTLTVADNNGDTASVTKPVTVTAPNNPPTAWFTSNCTNLSCAFDGNGSTDPGGSISSYAWNFGDGTTGTGATPTHPYPTAGTYTVTLTVTDNDGATDSKTGTISPTAPPPGSPFASDTFERNIPSGFGTADIGGAWTTNPASDHSVAGGTGRINLPTAGAGRTAYLGSARTTASDLTMSMSLDKMPTATAYLEVTGRRVGVNLEYDGLVRISPGANIRAGLRLYTSGTATDVTAAVDTGFTYAAGSTLNVRLQVTGTAPTTLRMKVWPASVAEPATWQVTGTDSTASLQAAGAPGLRSYLSGSTTNAPILWQVDNFVAQPVP